MTMLTRRRFLEAALATTVAAHTTRPAHATNDEEPAAILVLDFAGGWNVHATFAARTNPSVNPHGIYRGADTGVLQTSPFLYRDREKLVNRESTAWGTRIPGFEDEARELSIIGAMRHAASYNLDDHSPSARLCGTGFLDRLDAPGLGAVIARHARKDMEAPPAVLINPGYATAEMVRATGVWQPHAPLVLSHRTLPIADDDSSEAVRFTASENALDAKARSTRRSLGRDRVDTLLRYKEAFRTYRRFFLDPAVHSSKETTASARYARGVLGSGSPTTQQLIDAFGGTRSGDEEALALAFRFLEGGSRFVAIGCGFHYYRYAHDLHDLETIAHPLYVRDAQLLAGLSFVLKKTGLAKRVLVVALSEMARSTYPGTCFSSAGGTDHGLRGLKSPKGMHGSNRQSVLLGHGPIAPRREAYAAEPEFGDPIDQPCVTGELLAFLAERAGVPRSQHLWSTSPEGNAISADVLAHAFLEKQS